MSGFERYDVVLEPRNQNGYAMIMGFKVQDPDDKQDLSQTVEAALEQIDRKNYAVE